jgi:hypothetical protein
MVTRTIAQVGSLQGWIEAAAASFDAREPAAAGIDVAGRDGLRRPGGREGDDERTKHERAPEGALGEDPHRRCPRVT